jgi:hypothetical protein
VFCQEGRSQAKSQRPSRKQLAPQSLSSSAAEKHASDENDHIDVSSQSSTLCAEFLRGGGGQQVVADSDQLGDSAMQGNEPTWLTCGFAREIKNPPQNFSCTPAGPQNLTPAITTVFDRFGNAVATVVAA